MKTKIDCLRYRNPRFLLMYSALQFGPEEMAKPDGSLSLPYLAGALRAAGYDVKILDVSVGDEDQPLNETFFRTELLPSGLIRCGMAWDKVARKIADFDVIGISSIFTTQTTMVLDLIRFVKQVDPHKLVLAGGVNARNMRRRFFAAGAGVIALSEAERTIVDIGESLRGKKQLS
ncbi:MAG TPA: cobalamin B12-binding domain-containing protein, partial [Terriglobia bacterium]|nr:cobalamin B12-binding domain-containing protein [Terriglobia bacterium]